MKCVQEFLQKHWDRERFLLVGYSGGPDSKALLYSLLQAGCDKIHVAHVDHGWRQESALEALEIAEQINRLGLRYSSCRLECSFSKNPEQEARNLRFAYFSSLFQQGGIQALVLGHQADDLAETSLKRVFEGASLCFLGGMQEISIFEQIPLWRPLLKVRKQTLIDFLESRNLSYLEDSTNYNPLYLRSRMRVQTLPLIEKSFGKNFIPNLCLLSERSFELQQYFEKRVCQAKVLTLPLGVFVYCRDFEPLEIRFLLQKTAKSLHITLTNSVLEALLEKVFSPRSFKKIFFQGVMIVNVRGWIGFLHKQKLETEEKSYILDKII